MVTRAYVRVFGTAGVNISHCRTVFALVSACAREKLGERARGHHRGKALVATQSHSGRPSSSCASGAAMIFIVRRTPAGGRTCVSRGRTHAAGSCKCMPAEPGASTATQCAVALGPGGKARTMRKHESRSLLLLRLGSCCFSLPPPFCSLSHLIVCVFALQNLPVLFPVPFYLTSGCLCGGGGGGAPAWPAVRALWTSAE